MRLFLGLTLLLMVAVATMAHPKLEPAQRHHEDGHDGDDEDAYEYYGDSDEEHDGANVYNQDMDDEDGDYEEEYGDEYEYPEGNSGAYNMYAPN